MATFRTMALLRQAALKRETTATDGQSEAVSAAQRVRRLQMLDGQKRRPTMPAFWRGVVTDYKNFGYFCTKVRKLS